eukprot:gene13963-21429_t
MRSSNTRSGTSNNHTQNKRRNSTGYERTRYHNEEKY